VNSIRKTNFLSPTLNKNLRFNNSKLFLHLKWYLTIMPVNFYLNKRFFPHDITLIASVVGESAVSRSSGGILIPAKMARLAKKLVAGVSGNRSSSLDFTATQTD
jgi:hypothetical protein